MAKIGLKLLPESRWTVSRSFFSVTLTFIWTIGFLTLTVKGSSVHFRKFHFTVEPSDVVTNRGEDIQLHCNAQHGYNKTNIFWKKDNELLHTRQQLKNGSLYIQNVQHSKSNVGDVGEYQCFAEVPSVGTIISKPAHVQIAHMAKMFSITPETLKVYLGDIAMFQCSIDGIPQPKYSWYKNNVLLKRSNHIKMYSDGFLEITNVRAIDFGKYYCEAKNMNTSRRSRPAVLQENTDLESIRKGVAPSFVMKPQDAEVIRGSLLVLHCGANGIDRNDESPKITWLKGGVELDNSNKTYKIVGTGSLVIPNVQENNNGIYTCRASNMEDSIDAPASVNVLSPPQFKTKPKNAVAQVNSEQMFECDIYGVPPPKIYWMKDGKMIETDDYFKIVDHKNLRILGLLKEDEGMYQCFGKNYLGSIQASAQLVVRPHTDDSHPLTPTLTHSPTIPLGLQNLNSDSLPSEPVDLHEVIRAPSFVTLSWKPPTHTGPKDTKIISYSVFWKEKERESHKKRRRKGEIRERVMNTTSLEATIQHLKPNTVYEFRVQAYNSHGPGKAVVIEVESEEEVRVPSPPRNAIAEAVSPTSIRVKYEPPEEPNGKIRSYKIIYYEVGANKEAAIEVRGLEYVLTNLKQFRDYSFRVEAHNENGAGMSTEEFVAKTKADIPSDSPTNFTLEATSSTSIIVRWEPPPKDHQNGPIVGYKIRFKKKGSRRGKTVTTASNVKFQPLTDLEKGAEYSVRIAALSTLGIGPFTDWLFTKTYDDDLDESHVPGKPSKVRTATEANSISVRWAPPVDSSKTLVRGYTVTYGKGIPDVMRVKLGPQQRVYKIKNLQPASSYVIKVMATNKMGDGPPIYAHVKTEKESEIDLATPMMPPVGLKTIVLSSQTIVLTWTDSTLSRAQRITDNRYYTVRYSPVYNNKKYRYINSTDLNAHIDHLKPNTQYEFSVKVTKNLRKSTWSMSVVNTTQESAPGGIPRDLTPAPVEGNPLSITLSWQPPPRPNGQLTGYLIFYTTDSHQDDRDWVVHNVDGDKLSSTIKDLTPDTTYFFKMQARNNKGYGPMSPTVVYRTSKADGTGGGLVQVPDLPPDIQQFDFKYKPGRSFLPPDPNEPRGVNKEPNEDENDDSVPTNVMIIIIACVIGVTFCIAVVAVAIVICKKKEYRNKRSSGTYASPAKGKTPKAPTTKDVKPPDLWIHHDQMEMKNLDKSENRESSAPTPAPSQRCGESSKCEDSSLMDMEKRRNSLVGDPSYLSPAPDERYPRSIIRPKPIMISVDPTQPMSRDPPVSTVTAVPNGHYPGAESPQSQVAVRPVYPRTQYNTQYSTPPRVHAGDVSQTTSSLQVRAVPQQNTREKLALLDDDDSCLADTLDDPYLSRIGYEPETGQNPSENCDFLLRVRPEIFKYRGINSRDGKFGGPDERFKCHNPTGIRMLNSSLGLTHPSCGHSDGD
ncbi:neogenin-like isoform X9 [Octopus sinensis]|uniref:Neogenin-like isoform X9 n=1 Tax=Octopus sinensis TaxID=2607531 RepID=A0A7E6F3Z5_9MOLL|nr:neogenin-like isoform X9 [Octopus sinensis]